MILSDRDIRMRLSGSWDPETSKPTDIVIIPTPSEIQIQPASVDLRLGTSFAVCDGSPIDTRNQSSVESAYSRFDTVDGAPVVLEPGEFMLACTEEWCKIPLDLVARVEGRSSLGRIGIVIHATAGFIDPGFEGQITLELTNLSKSRIMLHSGMRIAQLAFTQLTNKAMSYASKGKYQGQEGVTISQIGLDVQKEITC